MGRFLKIFSLTNLTLITALTLSTIAAWYSILGLTAIFAAAVIPIIIMGGALEVSKVVTTVWLHKYWHQVKWSMRFYLVIAVIALAFLTSMGIFGFLSKAHSDQSLVSGDVQAKIALYDEKIRIARENIDANRRSLKQMDEAVDQTMGRSTTEQGADKAVQVRRSQARERTRLLSDIETEQKKITELNEARAPIAAEVRKVEAEVGPIKYIAALIYGDNPDANLLERAVRWVIILIVFVFDPLALTLVLAANSSRQWDKEQPEEKSHTLIEEQPVVQEQPVEEEPVEEIVEEEPIEPKKEVEQVYLKRPWVDKVPGISVPHQVYKPEIPIVENKKIEEKEPEPIDTDLAFKGLPKAVYKEPKTNEPILNDEVTADSTQVIKEKPLLKELEGGYVNYDGKVFKKEALQSLMPELFMIRPDNLDKGISTGFGIVWPKISKTGDIFVRVDMLPNRVYKFNGNNWIEINRDQTDSYLDTQYIKYLIEKIEKGEYDIEYLTEGEKTQIESFIKNQNT